MAQETVTKYGELLVRIRLLNNDSLRTMASKIGISPAYLSDIERGVRNIPAELDAAVLKAYPNASRFKPDLIKARFSSSKVISLDVSDITPMDRNIIAALLSDQIDYDLKRQIASTIKGSSKSKK